MRITTSKSKNSESFYITQSYTNANGKSTSFRAAKQFLEPPTYELHDVYRALSVLVAKIHYYLDTDKIAEEEMYDGLYAVCTDLLDDDVADILKSCSVTFSIIKSLSKRNLYYRTITSYFKGYKICRCRRTGIHASI